MADEVLLVLSTFPDLATARRIARIGRQEMRRLRQHSALDRVDLLLAGKVERQRNAGLLQDFRDQYEELQRMLLHLHPYETPEIIALAVEPDCQPICGG